MVVSGLSGNSPFYREVISQNYPGNLVKCASVLLGLQHLPRKPSCCCSYSSSSSLSFTALSTETPPDGYRRNVGICLVNSSKKKIFAATRIHIPSTWQMPQGGADEGEALISAAIRELREETGVTSAEFLTEVKQKLNRRWGTNYKGQAQKWFLFKFTGKEDEINLLGDGSEKPEFSEWSWMFPEQVLELAVDFKKPVYEQVLKVFSPYLVTDKDNGDCSKQQESSIKRRKLYKLK